MEYNIVNNIKKRFFNPALLVLILAVIALLTIVITILSYLNASVYDLSYYGLILLFSGSLLALVFVLSTIILDKRYRPSIAQYPYNYYLDRLFPLIALFCPSILVLLLCPSTISLIQRFTILLLIHCFILIPLFYYWSDLRQWNLLASSLPFNHPQVFFQIALAVIYPAIWGIYFSAIRYIRMGVTIDFSVYLHIVNPEIFIIICFIVYYFFPLLIRIASMLNTIRTYLWDHTTSLLYSIHIILLRYYVYFRLCEIIYKTHFLYHDIFSGSVGATTWDLKVAPFYRRVISYIYYHSFILTLIVFSFIFIELFLSKGLLYFGVYILFLYLLIFGLFRCFNSFGSSQFIKDVCLCDYLTHNFTKPRYPSMFWFYLGNANLWFGFEQRFHPDLVDVLGRTVIIENIAHTSFTKFHSALIYRVWGRTRINIKEYPYRITKVTGYPKPWRIRVAGIYLHLKHVRWFHTTRVLYAPLQDKIHPLTIHFIKKDPYAILALLNHPTANFSQIQKLSKNLTWPNIHKPVNNTLVELNNFSLITVLETNFTLRFNSLAEHGVIIGTYHMMKKTYGYSKLDTMQMRPDMVSYWLDSLYKYKDYLGVDQKHKSVTNFGRNQVITHPLKDYKVILGEYKDAFRLKYNFNQELLDVLDNLETSAQDPKLHIQIWAESLHLFPDKGKPPLLLDKTFDESNLQPDIIALIRAGEAHIKRISDELYILNISEETSSLPEESLDLFEGSFIQELLK